MLRSYSIQESFLQNCANNACYFAGEIGSSGCGWKRSWSKRIHHLEFGHVLGPSFGHFGYQFPGGNFLAKIIWLCGAIFIFFLLLDFGFDHGLGNYRTQLIIFLYNLFLFRRSSFRTCHYYCWWLFLTFWGFEIDVEHLFWLLE